VPEQAQALVPDAASPSPARRASTSLGWMQRLRRAFAINLSRCPRCGAALRVIAHITDPRVIAVILQHVAPRDTSPDTARAPP